MKLSRGVVVNALIGALACASAVFVIVTRDVASTHDSDGRARNLLSIFDADQVTRLELVSAGQKLAIERAPASDGGSATFTLVEPVKELADAATADKFLSGLAGARVLRAVEAGPPLASFGLDKPSLRVNVRMAKRSYRLALGGSAPAPEGARYVQVSSDDDSPKVVVVSKSVAEDLAVELDAFRLKSLVSANEADVTRISIASPRSKVVLRRSTGTNFVIEGEPQVLADRETVKSLFFQLSRLSANSFLSASDAEAALGPDRARFELELKGSKDVIRFEAGGSCPSDASQLVILRRSPTAQSACAARELEATLRLESGDFVDRHAFSLHADEVEELDMTGGKSKFALVRKGSGFVLHGATDSQVELEAGNQRITALLDALGEPVKDAKPSELGLEPAASTVTLRSSASRDSDVVQQVVRVGTRDAQGNLLVYREQDKVTLRVTRELARAFTIDSTLMYARKLTEFGQSQFISAQIEHAGQLQTLRRGANEALLLDSPQGFDADGALSSDLIQALGALTAERFVADRDDGSFGFARAAFSVGFSYKSEQSPKTSRHLRFGDEVALGVFATLDDDGPVFTLPRSVRDACDVLLINRSVFQNNPDALTGITLEAHGRTLHLERQGERLVVGAAQAFPQDRVPDLLEALGNLRAEAGVHVGPALAAEGFAKPALTLRVAPRVGPAQTLTVGAGDSWRSTSVFYVRVSGVDATYVMAQSKVRALSDAL